MYSNLYSHRNPQATQKEALPGREAEMTVNAAGGVVFKLDQMKQLDRFLMIGSSEGTYYASAKALTADNAKNIESLIKQNGQAVVKRIVEISVAGRAPKPDPALFALAMCMKLGDLPTRHAAQEAVSQVARTGTHLMHLAEYVQAFGGWGRGTRRAFANWYTQKTPESLGYQLIKYRQRDGWTHRDIMRLAHPKSTDSDVNAQLAWAVRGTTENLTLVVEAFIAAQTADVKTLCKFIADHHLPWEAIPTDKLNDPNVLTALLANRMPITALIRNLPRFTNASLLTPFSAGLNTVIETLNDTEQLKRGRVHPIQLLIAQKTYASGRSVRGDNSWAPSQPVVAALEDAFYKSFGTLEASGKRRMLALDISGSMAAQPVPGLSCAEITGALAMVVMRTEPQAYVFGFSTNLIDLQINKNDRLNTVMNKIRGKNFGGTDCAVAARYARENKLDIDSLEIYTDNETWAGRNHPIIELNALRSQLGHRVACVAQGMTATKSSINDPKDPDGMDVCGFDPSIPNVITDFVANRT